MYAANKKLVKPTFKDYEISLGNFQYECITCFFPFALLFIPERKSYSTGLFHSFLTFALHNVFFILSNPKKK